MYVTTSKFLWENNMNLGQKYFLIKSIHFHVSSVFSMNSFDLSWTYNWALTQADGSSDVTEVAPLEQPKGCTYDQDRTHDPSWLG